MSKSFSLSDFGAPTSADPKTSVDEPTVEASDAAFENGYKAGWDDAVRKNTDDATKLTADLSENLQQISFDYHAARTSILEGMEKTLTEILCKILPKLAQDGLGLQVKDTIAKLMNESAEREFSLQIHPENREAIEGILPDIKGLVVSLIDAPNLAPGQIIFGVGQHETELDIGQAIDEILGLSATFFASETEPKMKELQNG